VINPLPDIEILQAESFVRDSKDGIPEAWVLVNIRDKNGLIQGFEVKGSDWTPNNRQNIIRKELEKLGLT